LRVRASRVRWPQLHQLHQRYTLLASEILEGSRQVGAAGQVIDEIVTRVQRANQLIGTIATAPAEQSVGVGEINRAIVQLEQATQENAALVEAMATSSRSLEQEAHRLTEVVSRFRMAGLRGPHPAGARNGSTHHNPSFPRRREAKASAFRSALDRRLRGG
jgi:hypothetical protein